MIKKWFFVLFLLILTLSCQNHKEKNMPAQITDTKGYKYFKKARKFQKKFINDSAYYYLQRSEKYAIQNNDSLLLSQIYFNKARIDFRNSDLPSSENYCVKALQIIPQEKRSSCGHLYNLLGHIANQKGDSITAILYYTKAHKLYQNTNKNLRGDIIYHNNMGRILFDGKNYEQALKHIDSILMIETIKKNHSGRYAQALNNKAEILLKIHKIRKSKKLIDEAYQINDSSNNISGKIVSLLNYANYYQQTHQADKAKNYALQALHLAQQSNIVKSQLDSYKKLAEIDSINARYYLTQHMNITDSVEFKKEKVKEQTARIRYENHEKLIEIDKQKQIIKLNKIRTNWMLSLLAVIILGLLLFTRQYRKIKTQNLLIKKQNKELNEKNQLIENIYQEMHHRIKNNFDIINYVFIEKIISKLDNNFFIEKLKDLQNKIASMKELHLLLQDSKPTSTVPLKKYIEKVIRLANDSFAGQVIKFEIDIPDDIEILFKQASPIGLIVNEFITNSYKHSLKNTSHPLIQICAKDLGDNIQLTLKDNGKGLPEDFSIKKIKSQGIKMIFSLIRQLKAKIIQKNENGLKFIIIFPKKY